MTNMAIIPPSWIVARIFYARLNTNCYFTCTNFSVLGTAHITSSLLQPNVAMQTVNCITDSAYEMFTQSSLSTSRLQVHAKSPYNTQP